MMPQPQTKEDKERFFADLERLDDSTTETEDELEVLVQWNKRRKLNPPSTNSQRAENNPPNQDLSTIRREGSFEAPIIIHDTPKVQLDVQSTSVSRPLSPTPRPRPSCFTGVGRQKRPVPEQKRAKPLAPAPVPAPAQKRSKKAKDTIELVSEERRIFAGLKFFFVPNNDIARPRRMRIKMVQEYGAQWASKFDETVTHVIVESYLNYAETTKAFPDRQIPQGTTLVKASWLSDSVASMYLRDIRQSRFHVEGDPALAAAALPSCSSTSSDDNMAADDEPTISRGKSVDGCAASHDELTKVIEQLKDAGQLLSEPGSDDNISLSSVVPESSSGSPTCSDEDQIAQGTHTKNRGFACMRSSDEDKEPNPNAKTIAILQEMATIYDQSGDHWRTTAYRKAIGVLSKQKEWISTREEALALPQIGSRLADKIEEIVTTNRLQRLENAQNDPQTRLLQLFMGIYGVGAKQASVWIAQGHRTLTDLLESAELTANQKIGIAHYDDFAQRIPRAEVAEHAEFIRQTCLAVDKDLRVIIGGSYRRGSQDSGDIDLMITKPGANITQIRTLVNTEVVPSLFASGFMKCALATSSSSFTTSTTRPSSSKVTNQSPGFHDPGTGSKFHGASCLPSSTVWRRIDLLFVPWDELGAAMIYWTGNDIFNRSMRLLASKKGMRLNQHGLYEDVMRGPGRVKVTDGSSVEGKDERRIFEILGVPWREPAERNC